jgi:hypothetical protein
MAIYTTFFLADPREVPGGFPGWKPPLPAPVRREFRNPFTKQVVTIETREPEWPDESDVGAAVPQYRAASIQGRYEDYLEGRLPPFVRQRPHWAAKGLTDVELEPLLRAVGAGAELQSPLYAPPSSGAALLAFPPEFIPKLSACDELQVATRWAAAMSTPEHTHSASGHRLNDGWTTDEAAQILVPIVSLARQAAPRQRMYLLIEA